MNIDIVSALIIQTTSAQVRCHAWQDPASQKWMGVISLWQGDNFIRDVHATLPLYESEKLAITAMEQLVNQARSLNLDYEKAIVNSMQGGG